MIDARKARGRQHATMSEPDGTFFSSHRHALASDAAGPVLEYGQQDSDGGFLCDSSVKGISCRVVLRSAAGYGKGFLISTSGVTRIG
jgi:hypothetical protein